MLNAKSLWLASLSKRILHRLPSDDLVKVIISLVNLYCLISFVSGSGPNEITPFRTLGRISVHPYIRPSVLDDDYGVDRDENGKDDDTEQW